MLIDVTFAIIMVLAIIKGFSKGLIVGIFSLLAFIIGLAAALKLSALVAQYLENSTGATAMWLPVLSFALVFILVALLVRLGAALIRKTISLAMLGWADRIGGIIFFMIMYTIIFSIFLFFADKTSLIKPETILTSRVYNYVSPWGPSVINNLGKIVPVFKDLFIQLQEFFEKIGHKFVV